MDLSSSHPCTSIINTDKQDNNQNKSHSPLDIPLGESELEEENEINESADKSDSYIQCSTFPFVELIALKENSFQYKKNELISGSVRGPPVFFI